MGIKDKDLERFRKITKTCWITKSGDSIPFEKMKYNHAYYTAKMIFESLAVRKGLRFAKNRTDRLQSRNTNYLYHSLNAILFQFKTKHWNNLSRDRQLDILMIEKSLPDISCSSISGFESYEEGQKNALIKNW